MSQREQQSRKRKAAASLDAIPSTIISKRQKLKDAPVSLTTLAVQQPATAPPHQNSAKWWLGSVDPTPAGLPDDPCPVDWSKVPDVTVMHRDVYEMRSPWKPQPDYSISQVKETLNERYSLDHNGETWRKKFMKANKLVYQNLKLWYERQSIGLEAWVGKMPKSKKDRTGPKRKRDPALKYHGKTFTLYIQSPGMVEGTWSDECEMPLESASQASPYFAGSIQKSSYTMVIKTTHRTADLFISCFAPRRRFSLPKFGHRLLREEDGSFTYLEFPTNITQDDLFSLYTLASGTNSMDVCDMIIDHWRDVLQKEQHLREQFQSGERAWTDLPSETITCILDFEPHHLNAIWNYETVAYNSTVHTFWLDILELKGEIAYEKIKADLDQYCYEFLVDWMERLSPEKSEEIKQLLAYSHQFADHESYHDSESIDGSEMSHDSQSISTTDQDSRPVTPSKDYSNHDEQHKQIHESVIIESIEANTPGHFTEQDADIPTTEEESQDSHISGSRDPSSRTSHESFEPFLDLSDLPEEKDYDTAAYAANLDEKRRKLQQFVDELRADALTQQSIEEPEESVAEDSTQDSAVESGSEYEYIPPDHTPLLLLQGGTAGVCRIYHNHNRLDNPCYKGSSALYHKEDLSHNKAGTTTARPSHHIKMTIYGTPGFIIQNHTGYSTHEFRDLPKQFPDWDWERVRAVHCYENCEGLGLGHCRDMYPLIFPQPVYFDNGYQGLGRCPFQDDDGRWPSHPGYRNPKWGENEEDFEEQDVEMPDIPLPVDDEDEDRDEEPEGQSDDEDKDFDENESEDEEEEQLRRKFRGRKKSEKIKKITKKRKHTKEPKQDRWIEILSDRKIDPNERPTAPVFSRFGYGFGGFW